MREVRIFYLIESHEMTKNDIEDTLAPARIRQETRISIDEIENEK